MVVTNQRGKQAYTSSDIGVSDFCDLVRFSFPLSAALMGTPTAAGFHSALSGAFGETQWLKQRQNRSVMVIHVPDAHSFIDHHDLGSADMMCFKGRQLYKVHRFPLSHYTSWK